jgi:protoporphyrinogen oxidase
MNKLISEKYYSFGALVPSVQKNIDVVGLIFDHCTFPKMAPKNGTKLSVFLNDNISTKIGPDETKEIVKKNLEKMLGIKSEPDEFIANNWNSYFPVFGVNHFSKTLRLFELARKLNSNFYV